MRGSNSRVSLKKTRPRAPSPVLQTLYYFPADNLSPSLKIAFDRTRPAADMTRPRAAAPVAVAFTPGQHRRAYVEPRPATRMTLTAAAALTTRFRWSRHHAPPRH